MIKATTTFLERRRSQRCIIRAEGVAGRQRPVAISLVTGVAIAALSANAYAEVRNLNELKPYFGNWECFQKGTPDATGKVRGGGGAGSGSKVSYSIHLIGDPVTGEVEWFSYQAGTATNPTETPANGSRVLYAHSDVWFDSEKNIFTFLYGDSGGPNHTVRGTSAGWEGDVVNFITIPQDNGRQTKDSFQRPTDGGKSFLDQFYARRSQTADWMPAGTLVCNKVG